MSEDRMLRLSDLRRALRELADRSCDNWTVARGLVNRACVENALATLDEPPTTQEVTNSGYKQDAPAPIESEPAPAANLQADAIPQDAWYFRAHPAWTVPFPPAAPLPEMPSDPVRLSAYDSNTLVCDEERRGYLERAEKAEGELRAVDIALGNVSAFDDCPTRYDKIVKAMLTAARAKKAEAELSRHQSEWNKLYHDVANERDAAEAEVKRLTEAVERECERLKEIDRKSNTTFEQLHQEANIAEQECKSWRERAEKAEREREVLK